MGLREFWSTILGWNKRTSHFLRQNWICSAPQFSKKKLRFQTPALCCGNGNFPATTWSWEPSTTLRQGRHSRPNQTVSESWPLLVPEPRATAAMRWGCSLQRSLTLHAPETRFKKSPFSPLPFHTHIFHPMGYIITDGKNAVRCIHNSWAYFNLIILGFLWGPLHCEWATPWDWRKEQGTQGHSLCFWGQATLW